MLDEAGLREKIPQIARVTAHGFWSRAVRFHHLLGPPPGASGPPQPLWPGAAAINGGRFTPRGSFGSIYLATDPVTALLEAQATLQNPRGPSFTLRTPPWTVFAVEGVLTDLVDLTDATVQGSLGTNLQELTGAWVLLQDSHLRGLGPPPPTQRLGQAAYESLVVRGLKYHSVKNLGQGEAIVVFSDRLMADSTSYLEVWDPEGVLKQRMP